jgi:hypothetical protein
MPQKIINLHISRSHYKWIGLLLIFIMASGIRIYRVSNKHDLNIDESISIVFANYNQYGLTKDFNEYIVFTGKVVRDDLLWNNSTIKDAIQDIIHLRYDSRDLSHSNLYYSCLRLCFIGTRTSNLDRIIRQGFCLNFFFFLLSFFFMHKLACKLFDNYWLVILTMALAYLNPGSITNTLYLREYQLQEMLFVLITYEFIIYQKQIKSYQIFATWQSILKISILTAFLLLSGYFSLLYIAFIGLFLIYITRQQKNLTTFWICAFLVSLAFSGTLYCKYYDVFFNYNDKGSALLHSINFKDNLTYTLSKYWIDIRGYLFSLPVILLTIGIIIVTAFRIKKEKKIYNTMPLILSLMGMLWSIIIMLVLSWKGVYYIMSIFPILILFIPHFVSRFKKKEIIILVTLYIGIYSYKAITRNEVYMGILPVEKPYIENQDLPVIIATESPSSILALLSYYNDNRKCMFPKTYSIFYKDINKYDKSIIIMDKSESYKKKLCFPANYHILQQFSCNWYFDGYILQKGRR